MQVVNDASSELLFTQKGATQELTPVDLSGEPDSKRIVDSVDIDDLLDSPT